MQELNGMSKLSCEKCGSEMTTRTIAKIPSKNRCRSSQQQQFTKIQQCFVCRFWRKYNE